MGSDPCQNLQETRVGEERNQGCTTKGVEDSGGLLVTVLGHQHAKACSAEPVALSTLLVPVAMPLYLSTMHAEGSPANLPRTPAVELAGQRWTRRIGVGLLAGMLIHHWGAWLLSSRHRDLPLLTILNRWDAGLYTTIVEEGHRDALWAFFPLYPGMIRGLIGALGSAFPPAVMGCIVSTLALAAFVLLSTRSHGDEDSHALQATPWGLFLVLYSPASYALHSHHTEATFLLLSFAALSLAAGGQAVLAGLFAGLTIWTRNQGALVAVTVLLLLLGLVRQRRVGLRHVLAAAAVMGAMGFAFLGFEWAMAGDPVAFIRAQSNWTRATSWVEVVRALWLGNPWQNTSTGSIHRHIWFFGALGLAVAHFRRDKALGAYSLASFLPMFLQGEFVNVFRFTAVLFPLWFWAGRKLERAPRWLQAAVALGLIALNHLTTRRYALGQWSY